MTHVAVEAPIDVYAAVIQETSLRQHQAVTVTDASSAADALYAALGGHRLVIHALAERSVLDRLYDDLRRLGAVTVRTAPSSGPVRARLSEDEAALLGLMAAGRTLREAAAALHISPRTADRRVASARAALGVTTTIEALVALTKKP